MKNCKLILSLLFVLGASIHLLAQPSPPPSPTPLPGIAWLLAAGAALGAKKVYDKKREARGEKRD